jgi:hypothetical protein
VSIVGISEEKNADMNALIRFQLESRTILGIGLEATKLHSGTKLVYTLSIHQVFM